MEIIKNELQKKLNNLQEKDFQEYSGSTLDKYYSDYALDKSITPAESVVAVELMIEVLGMKKEAADLVAEILVEDKWSMRKLKDAVKYVVKTYIYKEIRPANILSYDKGIRYYDYKEMLEFDTGCVGFFNVHIPNLPNYKQTTDGVTGEMVDGGWWVREGTIIPADWKKR